MIDYQNLLEFHFASFVFYISLTLVHTYFYFFHLLQMKRSTLLYYGLLKINHLSTSWSITLLIYSINNNKPHITNYFSVNSVFNILHLYCYIRTNCVILAKISIRSICL